MRVITKRSHSLLKTSSVPYDHGILLYKPHRSGVTSCKWVQLQRHEKEPFNHYPCPIVKTNNASPEIITFLYSSKLVKMKAVLLEKYGEPEDLTVDEVEKPTPAKGEVLMKVKAVSLNDWELGLIKGQPLVIRMMHGLTKPKIKIPGVDVAGEIETIGDEVAGLKVGDRVYADLSENGFGAFAEYVAVPEKSLTKIPEDMSYEHAAAIPHASILAYQALESRQDLQTGQSVLVNGAGGGVGQFVVQLLTGKGLHLTGVDSSDKFKAMKSMGFHEVIDYRTQDFTKTEKRYDFIVDTKSHRPPRHYARVLSKKGVYITVGGDMNRIFQLLLWRFTSSWFTQKRLSILALKPNKGLREIRELYKTGKLQLHIDGPHSGLEQIPKLLRYFADAKHRGKVVVTVC